MLWRLVRAGDEAVERHRDVQLQLAHRSSSADMLVGPPSASEVIGQARARRTWPQSVHLTRARGRQNDLTAAVAVCEILPAKSLRALGFVGTRHLRSGGVQAAASRRG